jgi:predicted nucleic acid-binding protein
VWVAHLRAADIRLVGLLNEDRVLMHPFVLGELAMGNLVRRREILDNLTDRPGMAVATDAEVLHMVDANGLFGLGIGYIDAHLLAAVRLSGGAALWTFDNRLGAAAARLNCAWL